MTERVGRRSAKRKYKSEKNKKKRKEKVAQKAKRETAASARNVSSHCVKYQRRARDGRKRNGERGGILTAIGR